MYSSLINSINFVKSFKTSRSAKYNFIKTTYSTGLAKHLYSSLLISSYCRKYYFQGAKRSNEKQ